MAYTSKIPAAVVVLSVLFLAVTISPRCVEAQTASKIVCGFLASDTVKLCYIPGSVKPSDECCASLKSANDDQVKCLCDNVISKPSSNNLTPALFDIVHSYCGVRDKFACKDSNVNEGSTNKIAASVCLSGLVASLFF